MKRIGLYLLIPIILLSACAPSKKEKDEARDFMGNIRQIVDSLLSSESEYVANLRFIVKEMQVPGIEKDKKRSKTLRDSCSLLMPNLEKLQLSIDQSEESVSKLKEKNSDYPVLAEVNKLLATYKGAYNSYYQPLGEKLCSLKLPVPKETYSDVMMMCFEADSVLNEANERFNSVSSKFIEHYEITFE